MHSVKGDMENTLSYLFRAIEINAEYKEKAQKDEAFKTFWDDEDFKRIGHCPISAKNSHKKW